MSKVSVIIPNYNRAKLIGLTIENMLSQTLKPWEIIVVDDGSTDESLEIIRSFGSKVKLICQENRGPGASRNVGLSIATGEYIQFLDSDDLCSLNKLEVQVKALNTSGFDIAYSPWVKVNIDVKNRVFFESYILQQLSLPTHIDILNSFLRGWFIIFQSCLFNHDFIKKVGNFDESFMILEDSEFLFRMILQNPSICFIENCLTLYRIHSLGKLTDNGTTKERKIKDLAIFLRKTKSYCLKKNVKLYPLTLLIFQTRIWLCLKEIKKLEETQQFLGDYLHLYHLESLDTIFWLINFFQRIEGHFRTKLTGSRYSRLYQTSHPTEFQYQLIRDMGYEPIRLI